MSQTQHVRLFLSTVSEEFRSYRDALRSKFQRPNVTIHVQEDFIPTGTETLDKLDHYIKGCDAVVHLLGDRTGAFAEASTQQTLKARYPDLVERLPVLKPSLETGEPPLSYTQWEAYLAVYHRRVLLIAAAAPEASRDGNFPIDPQLQASQQAHRERLRQLGRYAEITFTNKDELVAEISLSTVLDLLAKAHAGPEQVSNIPIGQPIHFMGRDDALADITDIFARAEGRPVIAVLHGLRGVGKTTLAAVYAERRRGDYRAAWWIRAQNPSGMRADLVALGLRLGWVAAEEKDEPALRVVIERLRQEGDRILLIYDNAPNAQAVKPYLPPGGPARILITSNARAWRGIATPVEINSWPTRIGADYLIARTGRSQQRAAAEALSDALGGLPLAHEQAAAFCERLEISLANYHSRFEDAPVRTLDNARDAPAEYERQTVARTFALAISEASALHPAAEPLIVHASLLAPEPIPLFLFAEAREKFSDPFASALADDGLDEAVAALRAFALLERETVADDRDPSVTTDSIRPHRLIRVIAQERRTGEARQQLLRTLAHAVTAVHPEGTYREPKLWSRCAALLPHVLWLRQSLAKRADQRELYKTLLQRAGAYLHGRGAYAEAEPLLRESLAIDEKSVGRDNTNFGVRLNDLANLVRDVGRHAEAAQLYRDALAINEKAFGRDDPRVAVTLNNLANLLRQMGQYAEAESHLREALFISERKRGRNHSEVAVQLNNLATLLHHTGRYVEAEPLLREAVAIGAATLGREHPHAVVPINNLVNLLRDTGRHAEAEPLAREVLAIGKKTLGREHPDVAVQLNNLANLLRETGRHEEAEPLLREAIANNQKALGKRHPDVAVWLNNLANLLRDTGRSAEAERLYREAIEIGEHIHGREHASVAVRLNNLANLLRNTGRYAEADPLYREAIKTLSKSFDQTHPDLVHCRLDLAGLLVVDDRAEEGLQIAEDVLALQERSVGVDHKLTRLSAQICGDALAALGRGDEAALLRARYEVAMAVSDNLLW
ncbi:MAG TPA: FxSxx-COOH system tetratricopeptide repeat protein [Candidatus Binataceae bacterium]|nr:FxSxx-COOH system tetratricopeptide repeat protein [Candidatus Binataceae bacterium]